MKNTLLALFAMALVMTTISSCAKEEEETTDTEAPKITISSPTTGTTYVSEDEVHLEFEISDNDQLHEIAGYLISDHMGMVDTVWTESVHAHETEYSMHDHYTIPAGTMHKDYSVIVTASDHSGNETTETFAFHVMQ